MIDEPVRIELVRENKGWLGKFLDIWKNPQYGHIYVNKQSKNVNIYFGFRKLAGKILIWSDTRKARWVTKKWFRHGHKMVLWPDKAKLRISLDVHGHSFEGMGPKDWDILTDYLADIQVQAELKRLTENVKEDLDQYIIGIPFEFVLPWVLPFILILLYVLIFWTYPL